MAFLIDIQCGALGTMPAAGPKFGAGFGGTDFSSEMLQNRRIYYANIGIGSLVVHGDMLLTVGCPW